MPLAVYYYIVKVNSLSNLYSVKEAAEKIGISERRVRTLLRDERLKGIKVGKRTWLVSGLNYSKKGIGKRGKDKNQRKPKRKVEK